MQIHIKCMISKQTVVGNIILKHLFAYSLKYYYLTQIILFNTIHSFAHVALCGWAAKADDSFVCFGAKPDKGFLDMKSRRIRKW